MSAFGDTLRAHAKKTRAMTEGVIDQAESLAFRSIKVGSAITGSPGQPVDTGALRDSWTMEKEGRWGAFISTPLVYAPMIEHGIGAYGPLQLRSSVGGFHSVAITRAGWRLIVAMALKDLEI